MADRKILKNTVLIFVVIICVLSALHVEDAQAQQGVWTQQAQIPEYFEDAHEPPYLIAGEGNLVHAFNSQPLMLDELDSPSSIMHRQWTPDGGWTPPIDIFYDNFGGDLDLVNVISDEDGMVYLIFQKDFQDIYFSRTTLDSVDSSLFWSPPVLLARQSTHIGVGFDNIGVIESVEGTLVVIYSGSEFGNGLYYVYSSDHGDTWSHPYPIYLAGIESLVVTDPALYVSQSGMLHCVWSTFNDDGSGGPGYYANFDADTGSWSEPIALDVPGIRTPSIIEYDTDIFVSYYHFNTNGNWWRRSSDGGITWTDPLQLSPGYVGTNGRVSFVVDSNSILHGFFGERINDFNHGMWHLSWTGVSWTQPTPVVKGPQVRDLTGGTGFDPRSARAMVINGNLLLVTWTTDGFAGENGAWYSYSWLDAPELSTSNTAEGTEVGNQPDVIFVEPTDTNSFLPSPAPIDPILLESPDAVASPQTIILTGVLPGVLVLIGLLIVRFITQIKND